MPDEPALPWLGLLVALGSGLLIGLERERRKGEGRDRAAAGIRSFAIAAVAGALAQALGSAWLVVVGALFIAGLSAIAYARSRSEDPGTTTELALFVTYLIGVQCVLEPAIGAACGAGLAVLLAARARLHRFATRLLSDQEFHDGLLLAALGLIALPIVPNHPIEWLAGIQPRALAALVFVILALQAVGHVALRWLGPDRGQALTGFVSGFVSSTVTIATLGRRARAEPARAAVSAASGVLSTAATWIQVFVMSTAISPATATAVAPAAGAGCAVALALGLAGWYAARRGSRENPPSPARPTRALRPREALAVAALLTVVTLLVGWARNQFGAAGTLTSVGLAGLADAHAPVASLTAMHAGGHLSERDLLLGILLSVSANSATRTVVAFTTGGARYGSRLAASLLAELAAAWLLALAP